MNNIAKRYEFKNKQYFSILVFSIMQSLSLIPPLIMGKIIDDYIPNKEIKSIFFGILCFVLIPFLSILLSTFYNYVLIKYIRKKGNEISISIMRNLIFQEKKFFDQNNSMEILSYVGKEAVSYVNFYIYDLAKYYVYIVMSVVIFMIMAIINIKLALFQLLFIPVSIIPVKWMMKNINNEVKSVISTNAKINQLKGDVFKGIEYVKVNRLEEKKLKEVETHNDFINKIWGKISALDTTSGIWASGFSVSLFTGLTFGIGALFVLNKQIEVGQLVAVLNYCSLLYNNINLIVNTDVSKDKKEAEYEKLFSYIELDANESEGKLEFEFNNQIKFENVTFSYNPEEMVLNGIDIEFKKGEWTGIVGPSGSGKSTILDLLLKLYHKSEGQILIDGNEIEQINTYLLRDQITKISQDIYLFPGTIEDNFKLVNEQINEQEIYDALHFSCLDEYVASLPNGIKTDIGEAGKLMSGGEKQRLSIAIGLVRKNKILLLDEVTSNLDKTTSNQLMKNLNELKKEGYTIISITHQDDFLSYADCIYKIENGNCSFFRTGKYINE